MSNNILDDEIMENVEFFKHSKEGLTLLKKIVDYHANKGIVATATDKKLLKEIKDFNKKIREVFKNDK